MRKQQINSYMYTEPVPVNKRVNVAWKLSVCVDNLYGSSYNWDTRGKNELESLSLDDILLMICFTGTHIVS